MTQVASVMTRGVRWIAPQDSLEVAAKLMDDLNVGVLPVCQDERVIGMLTDRDIVVRAVCANLPADSTPVSDVMTAEAACCHQDDALEDVMRTMEERRIRRLPVLDQDEHLVGVLSLGDLAEKAQIEDAGLVLAEVSRPAAPDRSTLEDGEGRDPEDASLASGAKPP